MLKKLLLILFIIYNRLKAQRLSAVANHLAYVEAKMTNISVTDFNGTPVVDSRLIAQELGIQHKNLLATIKKYIERLEQKQPVAFQTDVVKRPQGGTYEVSYCYLDEYQATKLMTYSRNTEQVLDCKDKLVDAFWKANKLITQQDKLVLPQTYKDALKALIAEIEEKEKLEAENKLLEQENEQLSEAVDELFSYSSIIRVAKFNNVSETNFKWRKLKLVSIKLGVEIKRVPDPRFEYKCLYSHDVWRVAYPDFKLPETTTLVIKK